MAFLSMFKMSYFCVYVFVFQLFEIPFNSVNKWQMSIHDTALDLYDITDPVHVPSPSAPASHAPAPSIGSGVGGVKSSSESIKSGRPKGFSLRKNAAAAGAPAPPVSRSSAARQEPPPGGVRPFPEFMCVKGAPDVLMPKCSHFVVTCRGGRGHRVLPVDGAWSACVTAAFEEMAAQGERALAYAIKWMPETLEDAEDMNPDFKAELKEGLVGRNKLTEERSLCFVGLLSLTDPPREEVPRAIAACGAAGIQVVMVTGDYPATAQAIARKIGLMTFPTKSEMAIQRGVRESEVRESDVRAVAVHGANLDAMTEEDWVRLVKKDQIVFARLVNQLVS
jgi:magnesium-transporting ATPase (P-type)